MDNEIYILKILLIVFGAIIGVLLGSKDNKK